MQLIIKDEKKKIGSKIKQLRSLLSLTQSQLAKAVGISKGTLVSIEAGNGFTGDYLLAIVSFFGMSLHEFTNYTAVLPSEVELREKIKQFHNSHKSHAYKVLEAQPNLNAVIEFRLKNNFLKKQRTVNDIVAYCKTEYNLTYNSSVVSQALINAVNSGLLSRKKFGRAFKYQTIVHKN